MILSKLLAPYNCLSITGICKNAGKTTLLNTLTEQFEQEGILPALTSIGLDGEKTDVLYGTDKPQVYLKSGMFFATAKELLPLCTATKEIVEVTDFSTPLGVVVVCRARSGGKVILAGPSITGQLAQLREIFLKKGAQKVLIDGALSRRSLITPSLSDACLLVAGASFSLSYDALIEETLFNIALLTLPLIKAEENFKEIKVKKDFLALSKEKDLLYFEGALTDAVITPVIRAKDKNGLRVVVQDSSKVMLSKNIFYSAKEAGISFFVKNSVNLAAVAVNPYSIEGYTLDIKKIVEGIREKTNIPLYDTRGNCYD